MVQKTRNSGTKYTVPFLFRCGKKRNISAKNGTVVQKHGTVVQNTLFRFCSVVKKRNSSAKTGQWYKNTEQWYKKTLFRFCSVVPYKKKQKKKPGHTLHVLALI